MSTQLAVFPRMSTSVEVPADACASIKSRLSALNSSSFLFVALFCCPSATCTVVADAPPTRLHPWIDQHYFGSTSTA